MRKLPQSMLALRPPGARVDPAELIEWMGDIEPDTRAVNELVCAAPFLFLKLRLGSPSGALLFSQGARWRDATPFTAAPMSMEI